MAGTFNVPPGTNELISQHLVNAVEIARRTHVTRAAVANWLVRHPTLAALAIPLSTDKDQARVCVFWWPQVEACLAELGIPNTAKGDGRTAKKRQPKGPRMNCPVCGRDVHQRNDGTPRTHYPPPGRSDLTCSDPGRHCRGSHPEGSE